MLILGISLYFIYIFLKSTNGSGCEGTLTGLTYDRSNEGLTVTPYEWAALWNVPSALASTMPENIILSYNQLTSFIATPLTGFHSNNIDRFISLNLSHNEITNLTNIQAHDDLAGQNPPICLDDVDLSYNWIA